MRADAEACGVSAKQWARFETGLDLIHKRGNAPAATVSEMCTAHVMTTHARAPPRVFTLPFMVSDIHTSLHERSQLARTPLLASKVGQTLWIRRDVLSYHSNLTPGGILSQPLAGSHSIVTAVPPARRKKDALMVVVRWRWMCGLHISTLSVFSRGLAHHIAL